MDIRLYFERSEQCGCGLRCGLILLLDFIFLRTFAVFTRYNFPGSHDVKKGLFRFLNKKSYTTTHPSIIPSNVPADELPINSVVL